jgi:deazaflavin-dependent oxidoreductase (nitroreductase family)
LVVASKAGASRSPGWYHNLRADPHVEVNIGPTRCSALARAVLPDNPDYARLWTIVNTNNGGRYQAYQSRTSRQFPIIELKVR